MISLEFSISKLDFLKANFISRQKLVFLMAVLLGLIFGFDSGNASVSNFIITCFIYGVIFGFFLEVVFGITLIFHVFNSMNQSLYLQKRKVEFSEEGLYLSFDGFESRVSWKLIKKVKRVSHFLFIYLSSSGINLVSITNMPGADRQKLDQLLQKHGL